MDCGAGAVDLLIGDRLVIECDSGRHHTGEANYSRDRERDLVLIARGYRVIRLTYAHVLYEWERIEPIILDLIRRDQHLWPRKTS